MIYFTKKMFNGCVHNWGTKKEWPIFKGLQKTTLDLCLSYIIIIVMDCCMLIDKMMSYKTNKNILKKFGYYVSFKLIISNV
jgi:hypothetical protein